MEFRDPWNLEEDPWAIAKIKSHRFHPKFPGTNMELLISYQCDQEEQWITYQYILEDEPWLVAQYVVTKKLKYKHDSRKQLDWAQTYIKSVGKITVRHFKVNVTNPATETTEADIQSRRAYMIKHMHGLPLLCSAKHGLELYDVLSNTKWCDTMAKEKRF